MGDEKRTAVAEIKNNVVIVDVEDLVVERRRHRRLLLLLLVGLIAEVVGSIVVASGCGRVQLDVIARFPDFLSIVGGCFFVLAAPSLSFGETRIFSRCAKFMSQRARTSQDGIREPSHDQLTARIFLAVESQSSPGRMIPGVLSPVR